MRLVLFIPMQRTNPAAVAIALLAHTFLNDDAPQQLRSYPSNMDSICTSQRCLLDAWPWERTYNLLSLHCITRSQLLGEV